ncbi:AraC family transcriptional regulator [Aminobacter carboxidus]|uniref:Helix-turn-helix transcriptional regulator n=1 Tax=Aminobacter carboxidus TaxID=376165 RepID=A0ABR9GGK9_9HYPH|nr:AraC family transcriptional regulator [Aminobacter carboxidus]MBE1202785.1 helix-turn-helix transcriptional regulator [Aminobacter carboxidus]
MESDRNARAAARPAVFREPGALLYAGNCQDLLKASMAGKVTLNAWTRRGYPGIDLGNALPQVCSVGGWDATHPQDWGLREHCNEGVKIAFVARGSLTITMDGKKTMLTEGRMFVVRPWQLHALGDPDVGASHIVWVLLDMGVRRPHETWQWPDWIGWPERDRKRLTELLSKNEQLSYTATRDVARSFMDIADLVATQDIESHEARLRLVISMMLLQFREMLESQSPVLDLALASSKRTVEIFLKRLLHALDDDWTLENMAAECNLSRTQFTQHCLALTNMTPVRYLQMIRLDAARNQLEAGKKSVTNIAFDCGFSSSQYFATCYKKRFGHSPMETPREQELLAG